MSELNFDSPVPLYHQLSEILEQCIVAGQYKPGQQLPIGKDLAAQYHVGLQTVRAALTQLENKGFITRRAGRGTFVVEHRRPQDFLLDRSFSRQMLELGRKPSSKILNCKVELASPELAAELGIPPQEPILILDRLRYGDGDPVALQYMLVSARHCPDIEKHNFATESVYEVLRQCYGIEIKEITHVISCVAANRKQATLLGVRLGTPLLVIRTCAVAMDGTLIEKTLSYYRADRFEYRTTYGTGDMH